MLVVCLFFDFSPDPRSLSNIATHRHMRRRHRDAGVVFPGRAAGCDTSKASRDGYSVVPEPVGECERSGRGVCE